MKVLKIDDLIDACTAVNAADGVKREEIEKILVHALLVNICAEFEKAIKGLTDERCSEADDPVVCAYAKSFSNAAFTSPGPKNIGDAVKRFGDASGVKFARLRSENREAWEAYSSIVTNRNHAAHGRPVQVTMSDVREFYESGHVVLDWFRDALWVNKRLGVLDRLN